MRILIPQQAQWMKIQGKDAADFLHRLSTAPVRSLTSQGTLPACFLNAQGKIKTFFHLWHLKPEHYAFEWLSGTHFQTREQLKTWIQHYHFAEEFTLEDPPMDWSCRWIFFDPQANSLPALFRTLKPGEVQTVSESLHLGYMPEHLGHFHWMKVWGDQTELTRCQETFELLPLSHEDFQHQRIQQGIPWVEHEITEDVSPLEIGLHRAIAASKGCYPGQEVIEKMLTRGSVPRQLVKLSGSGTPPRTPTALFSLQTHQSIGTLTSTDFSCVQSSSWTGLALLRRSEATLGKLFTWDLDTAAQVQITQIFTEQHLLSEPASYQRSSQIE